LNGRAVFRKLAIRCRNTGGFHELWLPFRAFQNVSAGAFQPQPTLMGFFASTATSAGRSTNPGFHARYVPPSEFFTLLTVYSLHSLPTSRVGATHEVHPTERFPSTEPYAFQRPCPPDVSGMALSCSEDQKITMPRDSRALLPAEIRTPRDRSPREPMLSWALSPLQSVSRSP
jgi:hypothetical protein